MIVVFDLGRVLVGLDLDWPRQLDLEPGPVREWFAASPAFRAFECGELSEERFLSAFGAAFDRDDLDALRDAFAGCVTGLLPGAIELLDAIQAPCAALSNTNSIHWSVFDPERALRSRLLPLASHHLGSRKPEPLIFQRADEIWGQRPVLFLDDNAENIRAARAHGWVAEQVVGVEQATSALRRHGVLAPPHAGAGSTRI